MFRALRRGLSIEKRGVKEPDVSTIEAGAGDLGCDDAVMKEALRGLRTNHRQTDTAQTVWGWGRGDDPRPQFATERVTRLWVTELLDRSQQR